MVAAIDTNVLVRVLIRDDAKQVHAADNFISAGVWVSLIVLVETIWVLSTVYARTSSQLGDTVETLLAHKHIALQEPEVVRAALETYRSQSGLGFSDCLILETARKNGHVPLGTFDRRLAKISNAMLIAA